MKKLTIMDWRIVRAYADYNMNASAAAKAVGMHLNNVEYHLEKVKRFTGLNPKHFYDLVELMRVEEGGATTLITDICEACPRREDCMYRVCEITEAINDFCSCGKRGKDNV